MKKNMKKILLTSTLMMALCFGSFIASFAQCKDVKWPEDPDHESQG